MKKSSKTKIRAVDLFAGVGGSSAGARRAGVKVVAAVDTWALARKTYIDNFKGVTFYRRRCETLDPDTILKELGPIQLLMASPECTSHTCAKGSSERSEQSRRTAFQVVRFARILKPRWIVIENVVHMRSWRRYSEWLDQLRSLGYHVNERVLNAADFGVPQSRKRLFVICDFQTPPPQRIVVRRKKRVVRQILDLNGTYSYSALASRGRAYATLQRARRAKAALGTGHPFLLVYYGTDGAGGWQRITRPLRTITTVDRFAYVRRRKNGRYEMRMLQVPELKKAMGFPSRYELRHGTRRDRIKLLGNAVCPPVMEAVIRAITSSRPLVKQTDRSRT